MIRSFKGKASEALWNGTAPKGFPPELVRAAQRKLAMLAAADSLSVLRHPPGNRLEALIGKRKGQHSIRINDQWRLCFRWDAGHAHDVDVVDYH